MTDERWWGTGWAAESEGLGSRAAHRAQWEAYRDHWLALLSRSIWGERRGSITEVTLRRGMQWIVQQNFWGNRNKWHSGPGRVSTVASGWGKRGSDSGVIWGDRAFASAGISCLHWPFVIYNSKSLKGLSFTMWLSSYWNPSSGASLFIHDCWVCQSIFCFLLPWILRDSQAKSLVKVQESRDWRLSN